MVYPQTQSYYNHNHHNCFKCWIFSQLYNVILYVWSNENTVWTDFKNLSILSILFNRIESLKVLKIDSSIAHLKTRLLCHLFTLKSLSFDFLWTSFPWPLLWNTVFFHKHFPSWHKSADVTEAWNTIQIHFYFIHFCLNKFTHAVAIQMKTLCIFGLYYSLFLKKK